MDKKNQQNSEKERTEEKGAQAGVGGRIFHGEREKVQIQPVDIHKD